MWLIDILIFLGVLSVLIISHEFGHFIVARRNGIKVEKFSIGFGPVVFKVKRRDTIFSICAIPLGGYVKLAGEDRASCRGREDEFFSKPPGIRAKVIFAGPLFNYFLSFVILWFLFIVGMPSLDTTVNEVVKNMPAHIGGIEKGDKIIEVNNREIKTWDDLRQEIGNSQGKIRITVLRKDRYLQFEMLPKETETKDIFGRTIKSRKIGVYPSIITKRYNPLLALVKGAGYTLKLTFLIVKGFYYTFTGTLPIKEAVAGPVRLFEITSNVAQQGVIALLNLVSLIGISLAIINLFPIPILDGGHLFLILLEKLRRRPLSEKAESILTNIGIVIISAIMFFVFYNDIINIISRKK